MQGRPSSQGAQASPLALSLRTLVLLAILVPAGVALLALSIVTIWTASEALEHALEKRLTGVAKVTSLFVSSDQVLFLEPGDERTRTFQRLTRSLQDLKLQSRVERIQVLRLAPRAVVLDTIPNPKVGGEFFRADLDAPAFEWVSQGLTAASPPFVLDGMLFKTAYAPIEENGQVVAAVAISASAEYLSDLQNLQRQLLVLSLITLIGLSGLAVVLAHRLSRPLRVLSRVSDQIGQGAEGNFPKVGGPKEARQLEEHMRQMATEIRRREEELQMMVTGIAHEVRNPLGGMQLFAGLLADDLEGDERMSHVQRIQHELHNLERLVDDFLNFARKTPLRRESVSPREILESLGPLLEPAAQKRKIHLQIESPSIRPYFLDVARTKRALLNLGLNAVDAAPSGQGGFVRIDAAEQNDTLSFFVRDNGPGLAPENEDQAFRPFFTTKQQGTGLGLPLVKAVAERHDGTVSMARAGGETCFEFRVPYRTPPKAPPKAPFVVVDRHGSGPDH